MSLLHTIRDCRGRPEARVGHANLTATGSHFCFTQMLLAVLAFSWGCTPKASARHQQSFDPLGSQQTEFERNRDAGRDYFLHKRFAEAIPFLEKAHSINGSDYENEYELSIAYTKFRNWERARSELLHLLSIRDTAEAHTILGEVLTATHDRKGAAEQYQIAAQMEPTEDRVFDLGQSLLGFESDAAIKIFSYGVDKYPQSTRMFVGLGISLYLYGNYERASLSLCHAADMSPGDFRPIEFLGKLEGLSAEAYEQIDERLAGFLKLHPDNALANYYLARNLLNAPSGQPSEEDIARSEKMLQVALHSDPKLADAYFELGRLYEKQGHKVQAVSAYEQAITLEPKRGKYHYRLAFVYREKGEIEKAKQEMCIFEKLSAEASIDSEKR